MNRKLYFFSKIFACACVLGVVTMLSSFTIKQNKKDLKQQVVKDFKLKNVDDSYVSLSDYNSQKGLIVIFTCNTCPIAVRYENRLKTLHIKYSKLGFPVVAINSNSMDEKPGDAFEKMVLRAQKRAFNYPYLHDENQEVAKNLGAKYTPEAFVLLRVGEKFVVKYTGAIDNNLQNDKKEIKKYLENAVDELLAKENVSIKNVTTEGCAIRWKD